MHGYATNFEEVARAYWFGPVDLSVNLSVHPSVHSSITSFDCFKISEPLELGT